MKLISEKQTLQKPTVATIGFFDGVHKGHQFLLTELIKLAQKKHLESLVVTFRNSPQTLLHPEKVIKNLTTPPEKTALLEKLGISNCLLLDFNEKIATQKAKVFLTWLKENYGVQTLLIGYDHHFGADRLTSFTAYQAIGNELLKTILLASNSLDTLNDNLAADSAVIRYIVVHTAILLRAEYATAVHKSTLENIDNLVILLVEDKARPGHFVHLTCKREVFIPTLSLC